MEAKSSATDFPVVCVGGSAGGLDAYIRLLRHLPSDMGVAIVIVNHLRTVATRLHEILPRYTKMPVELITERLLIQPNRVFIIPEQRDLHILDGEFRLKPISKPRGWPDVITVFLRSLTQHWGGKLVAVIVSGYDGDGATALCGIKEVGGITIAQKLDAAGHPEMPGIAIASGCIDFVLSPEDIAQEIIRIAHAPCVRADIDRIRHREQQPSAPQHSTGIRPANYRGQAPPGDHSEPGAIELYGGHQRKGEHRRP